MASVALIYLLVSTHINLFNFYWIIYPLWPLTDRATVPIRLCLHMLIFIDKNYFCVCFWPSSHNNLSDTVQVHNILIRFEPYLGCYLYNKFSY